jgi:NADPH2:quinone reductase
MPNAIRFYETGRPEVLKLESIEVGDPGPGEARVRQSYIAVNFIDIYFRSGRYPLPLPNGLGSDAVGVVEAVGPGVTDVRVGDRVGYLLGPQGAYSDVRIMPANVLIPLPDGISDRTASTLMMKGMTAQYLFRQVYPLKGGETILYHAAAGGVGLIACQWAQALGVTMIGTVSSDEKAEIARAHGCTHTIVTSRENIAQRVRAHRRQGGAGGLRFRRQGHGPGVDRQPAGARHAGEQRHHLGARGHRLDDARGQGLAMGHPTRHDSLRDAPFAHAGDGG